MTPTSTLALVRNLSEGRLSQARPIKFKTVKLLPKTDNIKPELVYVCTECDWGHPFSPKFCMECGNDRFTMEII
jgi:hypothetical protein